MKKSTLKTVKFKNFDIWIEVYSVEGDTDTVMSSVYSKEGKYITSVSEFVNLPNMTNFESAKPYNNNCNIGFSEDTNEWFGWSHRAISGFGVGSTCKKGNCHYNPNSFDEYRYGSTWGACSNLVESYSVQEGINKLYCYETSGMECTEDNCSQYVKGRGEWTALSLEDAKEMAKDFANNV